jgi:hypothetical protein
VKVKRLLAFAALCVQSATVACAGYGSKVPIAVRYQQHPSMAKVVHLTRALKAVSLPKIDGISTTLELAGRGEVALVGSEKPLSGSPPKVVFFVKITALVGPADLSHVPGMNLAFPARIPAGPLRIAALENGSWITVGTAGDKDGKAVTFKAIAANPVINLAAYQTYELSVYSGPVLRVLQPPTLTSDNPNSAARGAIAHVTLTGTNFVAGATTVSVDGNVVVSSVNVTSSTQLTADFLGGTSAPIGAHNVTVTTSAGTSNSQTFTINAGQQSFAYTGAQQSFVVPPGVTQVTIVANGAQGGSGGAPFGGIPGAGQAAGSITATIAVTPGETLPVFVGGVGASAAGSTPSPYGGPGGFNGGGAGGNGDSGGGGGGGGSSDVRQGGADLGHRVVVAGGGGGGGGPTSSETAQSGGDGGSGGGTTGGTGGAGAGLEGSTGGGFGGSQSGGGAVGDGGGSGASGGQTGTGGSGGSGAGTDNGGGGGGGGGYYGGGGGGGLSNPYGHFGGGGGGGGSSYVEASATNVTSLQGTQLNGGSVVITW